MVRPNFWWKAALPVLLLSTRAVAQDVISTELEEERSWDPESLSDWGPASWSSDFVQEPGRFTLDLTGGFRSLAARSQDTVLALAEPKEQRRGDEFYAMASLQFPLEAFWGGGDPRASSRSSLLAQRAVAEESEDDEVAPSEHREAVPRSSKEPFAARHLSESSTETTDTTESTGRPNVAAPETSSSDRGQALLLLATREIAARVASAQAGADLRLKSLVRRSRWSGLSPELRLRGVMGFDRTTSTDEAIGIYPGDTTTRGGRDSLAEVRLTFRLDRLVLGDGEDSIERQRIQLSNERRKSIKDAIDLFIEWRFSHIKSQDSSLPPDDLLKAQVNAEAALAQLHLLTGGWFVGESTLKRLGRDLPHSEDPE